MRDFVAASHGIFVMKKFDRFPELLMFITVLVYFVIIVAASLHQVNRFGEIEDLDVAVQGCWSVLHGYGTHSFRAEGGFFSLHVMLMVFPVVLVFALYPGPHILLILRSLFLAGAGVPLFYLARRKLQNSWLALLFTGTLFLYFPYNALSFSTFAGFHMDILAAPLLILAFCLLEYKKHKSFFIVLAMIFLLKENMAFLGITTGLYLFFFLKKQKLGLFTLGAALLWIILSIFVILPLGNGMPPFSSAPLNMDFGAELGQSLPEVAVNAVKRPLITYKILTRPENMRLLHEQFWPLAYLPALSPEAAFISLPIFLQNFLADDAKHKTVFRWYQAPIYPFLFLALILSVQRLGHGFGSLFKRTPRSAFFIKTCLIALVLILCLYSNFSESFFRVEQPLPLMNKEKAEAAATILRKTPESASLLCTRNFLPHAALRRYYASLADYFNPDIPHVRDVDWRYVLVDEAVAAQEFDIELERLLMKYKMIDSCHGITLYRQIETESP